MKTLENLLKEMDEYARHGQVLNTAVSAGSIGWHIAHSALVIQNMAAKLSTNNPALFKPRFSILKWVIILGGIIPRGKRKAPKLVVPQTTDAAAVEAALSECHRLLKTIESAPENAFVTHPFFGDLRKPQALRFIQVHTNHHVKIMRDIVAAGV